MACYNHPNAPTVALCERCHVEMCGMCAQFLPQGEYCEKCAEALAAASFVNERSNELNRPRPVRQVEARPETLQPPRRRDKDHTFLWLGFGGASAMIFFAMLVYAFPTVLQFDAALAAEREAEQRLEDCRLVFEEIGYLLERGELPDASYRCAETDLPNIVTRQDGALRVAHPNPGVFGLTDLYVTSDSHEVIFIGRIDN